MKYRATVMTFAAMCIKSATAQGQFDFREFAQRCKLVFTMRLRGLPWPFKSRDFIAALSWNANTYTMYRRKISAHFGNLNYAPLRCLEIEGEFLLQLLFVLLTFYFNCHSYCYVLINSYFNYYFNYVRAVSIVRSIWENTEMTIEASCKGKRRE